MAQITKAALIVENNTNFPNNNTGYITPALLREFNTDMIDSTVNQTVYNTDSASFNDRIDNIAPVATGSLLETASVSVNTITFTKGDGSTFNVTVAGTNVVTGSFATTGSNTFTGLNTFNAGISADLIQVDTLSEKIVADGISVGGNLNVTGSISASGYFVGDGSKLTNITASFTGVTILNDGVPQGTANSLNFTGSAVNATVVAGIAIIDVEPVAVSLTALNQFTASIAGTNTFTQSAKLELAALESFTASVAGTNTFTASANSRLNSIEAQSGSWVTSAITASSLTTASFSGNTLTFTKGNGTTFGVILPDVSGSTINTGSFVTNIEASATPNTLTYYQGNGVTSSITLNISQTDISSLNAFTASVAGTNAFTASIAGTNAFTASIAGTNAFTQSANQRLNSIESQSGSWVTESETGSFVVSIASDVLTPLTFNYTNGAGVPTNVTLIAPAGTDITALNNFTASVAGTNQFTASIAGTNDFTASIKETNTFTASLAGTNTFTASIAGTNTFTASANSRLNSIEIFTASVAGTNAFTASAQNSLNSLNAATSSYITSAVTASMAVSSSLYAVTSSLSRNVVVTATNDNQSTLPIGTVVRISGATGDVPRFNTASYTDEAQSSNTLGILNSAVASGASADITVVGVVTGINTDGMTAGDLLYLGANGTFTNVQPQAPLNIVTLGEVLRVQLNNGSMFVNVSNGWELNELHNVRITSPAQGDLLVYEASSSLWKNQSSSSFAKTNQANTFTANQIVSGSMTITGNLNVFGSASFTTVTSSVYIGGNTILLNTFTPSVRYGGIEVIDSGSTGLTGSLLWDSVNDVWIYVNPSGSSYTSARLISGPQSATLGNEPGLVNNYVMKAVGDDHISSSQIYDDGTTVTIPYTASIGNIVGIGSPSAFSSSVDSRINALVAGTTDITALNAFTASIAGTNAFTASIAGTNGFTASAQLEINSLEAFTASVAGTNAFTASTITSLNAINSFTASNGITALNTFTASIAGTNAFTQSATLRLNSLESTSASVNTSISSLNGFTASVAGTNTFTASAQLEINALEGFSASTITRLNGIEAKTGSYATTGSNSFIGNQTVSGSSVYTGSVQGNVVSMSIASNTASMDFNAGNFFTITLASGSIPTYINPTNIKAGQTVSLVVTQASTLSGSLAFPTTFKFPSGSAYVPTAVTSSKDIVTFITVDTTTIYASSVKNLI